MMTVGKGDVLKQNVEEFAAERYTLYVFFFQAEDGIRDKLVTGVQTCPLPISPEVHERPSNHALGLIPGLANGFITAAILSALLLAVPLSEAVSERTRESVDVNRLAGYAQVLEAQLRPVFGEAIARSLNLLTVHPDSNERVSLPFTV